MKISNVLFFVFLLLIACKDDKELDDDTIPDWLVEKIDELEKSSIRQYFYVVSAEYNGERVFRFANCCPMCSTVYILYTVDGTEVKNADPSKVKNEKIIWKPDDFSCVM